MTVHLRMLQATPLMTCGHSVAGCRPMQMIERSVLREQAPDGTFFIICAWLVAMRAYKEEIKKMSFYEFNEEDFVEMIREDVLEEVKEKIEKEKNRADTEKNRADTEKNRADTEKTLVPDPTSFI